MVTGRNYYNDPIALESQYGQFGAGMGGMVFYSMASPILRDDDGPSVTSPVIRTTFPESWIFDTEYDNG